ncbi:MAG: Fe-S cluster assembly protein SufD [Thermodesulfobacteriota bacterium]
MGITFSKDENGYSKGFEEFRKEAPGKGISWLESLREEGFTRFSVLGFPTPDNEDWRFTNVSPIARASYVIETNGRPHVSRDTLKKFMFPKLKTIKIVFIDGAYSPELSDTSDIPAGVMVKSLSSALETEEGLVKSYLAKYADYKDEAFTALNTAFMQDGGFIYIPGGTHLKEPVHLLYITTGGESATITNPRNLIVVENNCQANIVEHYVALDENIYFSNVVTELVVGENSSVGHYMIECESRKAFNVSTLRVQQGRSSNIRSHSVLLGGALVRNNIHPVLAGEGCDSLINGLYMSTGRQHMDNYMKVEHVSPHCDSRQFYNGVLDGRSRGVFHGRIIVHKDAQKTDAKQTNRNLLLSDTAQIDTKPQLEIYADDVKCTHGATIGQMDENALFYLRSRGISEDKAKEIILSAFTSGTLESMQVEEIRNYCEDLVADWFSSRKQSETN